jgi:hypothetical protein
MSTVSYGDTFYLYGVTEDSSHQGWIVPSSDDGYYVMCGSCGNNTPFPIFQYTIIPGTTQPNNSNNMFSFNGQNLQGKPVNTQQQFYIGYSSALGDPNWASNTLWMSVTGSYGDIWATDITNYPYNGNLKATSINNNVNNTFIYGQTTFQLSLPGWASHGGPKCQGVNVKSSPFGFDLQNSVSGQNKIAPYLNNCSSPFTKINFVFVPTTPYQCVNSTCSSFTVSTFNQSNVGTGLYTSPSACQYGCGTYGCNKSTGQCQPGTGNQSLALCQSSCVQSNYGCVSGKCQAGLGSQTLSDCQQSCTKPQVPLTSHWWFWLLLVLGFIFLIIVVVLIAFLLNRK